DLPAGFGETGAEAAGPAVRLTARLAGREQSWDARIVRSEGVRDARTRMLHVVARVDDPYALGEPAGRTPLAMGLFVEATIRGREATGVFDVPRSSLRRDDKVLVVDGDDRVRVHDVEVLRSGRERSWIRGGLVEGDRLVISPLEIATDGMRVRVIESDPAPEALAADEAPGAPSS
ncbi:MAG: efflux RND transporter periplasmic adaptor subunit, partial [Myxococcales bacterium]|nr:efflux RND transporter periplasmic adaptor subunit [Myxococcales bacterium]